MSALFTSLFCQCLLPALLLALPLCCSPARAEEVVLREEFASLDNWEGVFFPKIPRHSTYTTEKDGEADVLVARSDASASAIRYRHEFDVRRSPVVRWRWKVDNLYAKGNLREKEGDDYPLRVYVMFKYDPEQASFGESVQYGLAKLVYGAYPPHSSLNYIWASREEEEGIHPSPYTDRARMIVLRAGKAEVGRWVEEEVNVLDDYRRAFNAEPPATAALAIMTDGDNTGEGATAYMDYIEVREGREQ